MKITAAMAMVYCFDLMVWLLTCDAVPTQRTSALALLEFNK
jgi:hypothetical protein